jgi:hypothetical protein
LTPSNVNSSSFGLLFQSPVDGEVYAQPLYVANLYVLSAGHTGSHNVAFVATENDSVYAIDADTGIQLWADYLAVNQGGYAVTAIPNGDTNSINMWPSYGITGTPVIDPVSQTLYVVTAVKKINAAGTDTRYVQSLHAIDITTGFERSGSPVVIGDTSYNKGAFTYNSGPSVAGTGYDAVQGTVHFNALNEHQRGNLVLANGRLYIPFASHGGTDPYHGWLLSYDPSSLALNGVFNVTPNGEQGGIWQAGGGPLVDDAGNIYLATGNGTFDTTLNAAGFPASGDYGDSVLKLIDDSTTTAANPGPNGWGLKVADYFSPYNTTTLFQKDQDLCAGGIFFLPDSAGTTAHPHLLLSIGKTGTVYLLDRDNLGRFFATSDNVIQEFQAETPGGGTLKAWSNSLFFNSSLYFFGTQGFQSTTAESPVSYSYTNGKFASSSVQMNSDAFAYPGATSTVSSNQGADAVLWAADFATHELRAYDALNPSSILYHSGPLGGRDGLATATKFIPPVVANGKVYLGTGTSLAVFGLLNGNGGNRQVPAATRDFNGDGISDIAFRQASTGQMVTWLEGSDGFDEQVALPVVADQTWQVVGSGDFNGDGSADLLWRQSTTGQNVIWLMKNGAFSSQLALPTVVSAQWQVAGIGDFNGDGTADILWRNASSGQNVIWLMKNGSFSSQVSLPIVGDLSWKVAGIADFNGDGTSDILWRDASTGGMVDWSIVGGAFKTQYALPVVGDQTWQIQGVGPFSGSATAGIVWRNSASGGVVVWTLSNGVFQSQLGLPIVADQTWQIRQVGDYDGDGGASLLWRQSSTGTAVIWVLRQGDFLEQVALPNTADTTWSLQ